MLNPLSKISAAAKFPTNVVKTRREQRRNAIRIETIAYLSANGMLKDGVN